MSPGGDVSARTGGTTSRQVPETDRVFSLLMQGTEHEADRPARDPAVRTESAN